VKSGCTPTTLAEIWNPLLRRIFGPKRDEVMREWRKLHNKELNEYKYN
jgi:hypothetical protein